MTNSIRTPKQGTNANSRRIAQAVDNEEWQKVRLSMKGISTTDKLDVLYKYYDTQMMDRHQTHQLPVCEKCEDVKIRIDNYLKSLARGGQLYAGVSLQQALDCNWQLKVRK